MRKIYGIFALLLLFAVAACTPEEDDIFDKSAAERIDETIEYDLQVLRGAENGWILNYYPSLTRMYGGYVMLLKFHESGKVDVSCDIYPSDKVAQSDYQVEQSMGAMLTFDTYNEIMHFFSEPNNDYGIGEVGTGMGGDYEFSIIECSPEKVVLKGKKTGNEMVMTPMPADQTWENYLDQIAQVMSDSYPPTYTVKSGDASLYTVSRQYHTWVITNKDGSSVTIPFTYTSEGVSLYEETAIGSEMVKDFRWDNQRQAFISESGIMLVADKMPAGYHKYTDFIGSYVLVANGEQYPVTVSKGMFDMSYFLKGLPADLMLSYNAAEGCVALLSQGLANGNSLCAWDAESGYLTNNSAVGMNGVVTKESPLTITFEDNMAWGNYSVNSFIEYNFSTSSTGFRLPYLQGMVKMD